MFEAGVLGTFDSLTGGLSAPGDTPHGRSLFRRGVGQHGVPVVAARLLRAGVPLVLISVVAVVPATAVVAFPAVFLVGYALYGLPFVVVVEGRGLRSAVNHTLQRARSGGSYLRFVVAHLVAGAFVSVPVSALVRTGVPGVLAAVALTAPLSVFVAAYGVLVFRDTTRLP